MKPTIIHTDIPGLAIIQIEPAKDERGWFKEPWNDADFREAGLEITPVQEGHSYSKPGVLRGMHMQDATAPMGKLIRCTRGEIFDVAVDLRIDSPTFSHYVGIKLDAKHGIQFWIPPGFLHGFYSLTECEVQYKQTGFYNKAAEIALVWNDPNVAIAWPFRGAPVLSEKDARAYTLEELAALYNTNPIRFFHFQNGVLRP